ncbi:hypothetical protein QEH59_00700 [Coraliomargarita sp. SDUM461004]|uniref:PEP-CTERM protein-sorting domain-containing protein n=2 Tax=Thalassobacterium sedimentorum TaxID=3041258 RepID=A0ABU1AH11_9BACT|nr:hypothetical protein [Coraliomargarita sp. SDUM461004]
MVSHADLIVSETFNYTIDESVDGKNGGTGWSGAWNAGSGGVSPTTDYNISAPTGYSGSSSPVLRIASDGNGTLSVNRNLATGINMSPSSETSLYFSFLWARTDTNATNGSEAAQFTFQTTSGTPLAKVGINGNEQIFAGFDSTTSDASQTLSVTNNTTTTGNYLLVGKILLNQDGTDDELYLSVFDSSASITGEPTSWDLSTADDISGTIGRINLSSQRFAQSTYWDNISIGTSFADVTNIPEPSVFALTMGVGALCIMGSRRKRSYTE